MRMAVRAPITNNPSSLPSAQLPNTAPSANQGHPVESKEHLVSDIQSPKTSKRTSPMSIRKPRLQKLPWFSKRKAPQVPPASSTPTFDRMATTLHQQNQHDALSRSAETESSKHMFTTNPWQDEASASRSQEGGTRSSFSSHATTLTTSTWPSPANEYSGFCKGAYYLQAGLNGDGMRLRNMSTAKTGEGWYWGCQNKYCVFEGPACKVGKEFVFDDTVRAFKGIKYRWAFLAKSHVALKRSKDRIYDYRCIFCTLKGISASSITRIVPFLEHVAEHQGQHLEESILRRTLCINDRIAADDEYFDINFPPSATEPEPTSHESAAEPVTEAQIPKGGLDLYESLDDDPWRQP